MEPQIIMTDESPNDSEIGANETAPIRAPSFPHAALIPFKVDLQLGEKVIDGSIKVVAFGPKFAKKKVKPYNVISKKRSFFNPSKKMPITM